MKQKVERTNFTEFETEKVNSEFDFSLERPGATKFILNKKQYNQILENADETLKEIFESYGPFKYSDDDWYTLGLSKSDLQAQISDKYIGQVRKGTDIKEGKGVSISKRGDFYEGFWKDGKHNGKGRMIYAANALYQGDWKDGRSQGFGIYYDLESGGKRKSEFKNGKCHGDGIEQWPEGTTFKGSYKNGMKEDFCVFKWADGSSYSGNIHQDKLEGLGTLKMEDGRKYEGYFENNKMHGEGTFTWPDGKKYIGSYYEGQKHGKGKLVWPDGREYYGEWIDGKAEGEAIVTDETGMKMKKFVEKGEIREERLSLF